MDIIDYAYSEEYIEVGCNCHPETCGCGGTRTVKNPNYNGKKEKGRSTVEKVKRGTRSNSKKLQ
jgi:hypothetical protein